MNLLIDTLVLELGLGLNVVVQEVLGSCLQMDGRRLPARRTRSRLGLCGFTVTSRSRETIC